MNEEKLYRGYRLQVSRFRGGWKVVIVAPGSAFVESEIPHTNEPNGQEAVLQEAMAVVDRALAESD